MTKEQVLKVLQEHPDAFVSGAALAEQLRLSRTAVWKAIRQLKADGYVIEAVTSQGYRLLSGSDVLSAEGIARYLRHPEIRPQVFPSLTSTNTVLKSLAAEDAPAGTAVLAVTQTAGRAASAGAFIPPPPAACISPSFCGRTSPPRTPRGSPPARRSPSPRRSAGFPAGRPASNG